MNHVKVYEDRIVVMSCFNISKSFVLQLPFDTYCDT